MGNKAVTHRGEDNKRVLIEKTLLPEEELGAINTGVAMMSVWEPDRTRVGLRGLSHFFPRNARKTPRFQRGNRILLIEAGNATGRRFALPLRNPKAPFAVVLG